MLEWVADRKLELSDFISEIVDFEHVLDAFRDYLDGKTMKKVSSNMIDGVKNMKMRQAVMIEPGNILFRKVDVPQVGDRQIKINIKNIGVCGSDIHVNHGKHPYTSYPVVQGHEISAEVVEVGKDVKGIKSGDKVTIQPQVVCGKCFPCRNGMYHICEELKVMGFQTTGMASDYFVVDADKATILPESLNHEEGAMVEPLAVAVHAVRRVPSD